MIFPYPLCYYPLKSPTDSWFSNWFRFPTNGESFFNPNSVLTYDSSYNPHATKLARMACSPPRNSFRQSISTITIFLLSAALSEQLAKSTVDNHLNKINDCLAEVLWTVTRPRNPMGLWILHCETKENQRWCPHGHQTTWHRMTLHGNCFAREQIWMMANRCHAMSCLF